MTQDVEGTGDAQSTGELRAALGRRQARLAAERRRRRATSFAVLSALLLVGVFGVVVLPLLLQAERPLTSPTAAASDAPPEDPTPAPTVPRRTLLLVRSGEPGGPATGLTLLSAAGDDSQAVVVFVPTGLLVDIPGVGLDRLAQAHRYGGQELVARAVEQALGIDITHTAGIADPELGALLGATGPLTVDIGSEPLVGAGEVAFEAGEQELDAARLAQYWTFSAPDEAPLDGFARQQEVLEALFRRVADDSSRVDRLLGIGGPLLDTDAGQEDLRALVGGLADAQEDQRLALRLLPVEPVGPIGAGGEGSYRLANDAGDEVAALLALGPPVDDGVTRVQVLDGVGEPGVSQAVEQSLSGDGFRVVLTDNAPGEVPETEIVIYDDSEDARARAEEVRDQLGVGTITTSSRPQTAIDVTVVVGADFPGLSTTEP